MNWVNSRSDHGHEDSTINIVVIIIIFINATFDTSDARTSLVEVVK